MRPWAALLALCGVAAGGPTLGASLFQLACSVD